MRRTLVLALLPVGAVSTKCAAGRVHKNDLTNLFCATSGTDAASCDAHCCTKADTTAATPTCGGVNPLCAFGTYHDNDDAWKNTKTGTTAAKQQADCCKPTVTCDNTLYSCPAGYKKSSTNKGIHCPGGPKTCAGATVCCEKDTTTCGGATAVACDAGSVSITSDDAGKKTKIPTGKTFKQVCCALKPTCASVTCKMGQVANAAAKAEILSATNKETTQTAAQCDKANGGTGAAPYSKCLKCCVNDPTVNTCGNPTDLLGVATTITCPGGTYNPLDKDKTHSYYNVIVPKGGSVNSICCVPTATCANAVCPAGYKKKANVDTLSCHGNHDACNTICCEVDKLTCGGLQSSISCAYGTYDESTTWILSGDKKTSKAVMDAWKKKATTAATKNTDCCTAAASCKKEPVGTTTPAAVAVTTTPVVPI